MEEEIIFVQDIPEEDKKMLLMGIQNIEEVLEEEQGVLTFAFYSPKRMYPFGFMDEGEFGIVFQYKHYAIKYIKEHYLEGEELEHESSIYRNLQGIKGIPTLYGYSYNFLIMELVEGHELVYRVTLSNQKDIQSQVREMLESILDRGYIPYDIEFFITSDGKLKALDVGLFRASSSPSLKKKHLEDFCRGWNFNLGIKEEKIS